MRDNKSLEMKRQKLQETKEGFKFGHTAVIKNGRKRENTMARNGRDSEGRYNIADRGLALVTACMELTKGITAAKEDLAKTPADEHAQDTLGVLEGTLLILVDWGHELTEAFDKEYGPTDEHHREVSEMLHGVFVVPLVN